MPSSSSPSATGPRPPGWTPTSCSPSSQPVPVTNVELGQVEGRSPDDETAAFLMTMVLFFAISTYGAMVLSGVVEEKSSRTVEVLLARMPARNLLAGKIAGIGMLGLVQIAATAIVALVAASLADSFDVPAVRGSVIAWAVVWFVLGYALYATVFGTLGSLASRTEDASSVTGPVSIILVLGFIVSFAAIGSADTTWAQLVAWFPITAPLAMPNRIAMGAATWWDPVLAALLTVATIAGLVVLGGRVYTRAILHTGATLSLGEAWRGAPAPSHAEIAVTTGSTEAKEVPAVQSTKREARTQLVLIVIAIAIGAVVFALAGDFVIGVGVGAGVFALARQAMKAWGRKDDHARTERARPRAGPSIIAGVAGGLHGSRVSRCRPSAVCSSWPSSSAIAICRPRDVLVGLINGGQRRLGDRPPGGAPFATQPRPRTASGSATSSPIRSTRRSSSASSRSSSPATACTRSPVSSPPTTSHAHLRRTPSATGTGSRTDRHGRTRQSGPS